MRLVCCLFWLEKVTPKSLQLYSIALNLPHAKNSLCFEKININKLKNYLHYKMIASKNIVFEAQFNFFISWKCHVLFLRFSTFQSFTYSIHFKNCGDILSISKQDIAHFWIHLSNCESLGPETWPSNRVIDNTFTKNFT